MLGVTGYLKPD